MMFLSCRKATELVEKQWHFRLTPLESAQLKFHKSMCEACARYEKQSLLIEQGIASFHHSDFIETDINALKKSITDQLGISSKN